MTLSPLTKGVVVPIARARLRAAQRPQIAPTRAIYKPPSKLTTVAAFLAAVMIHIAAVVFAGFRPEEPAADLGPSLDQVVEVSLETAAQEPPTLPVPEDEPLDAPPPPVAAPDIVEEQATPPPKRSSRPISPIARPQIAGLRASTVSMSSAKAVAISAPRPAYPYEARRSRITGSGVALMTVDPSTGAVTSAVMAQSTGSAILDNAATSAFRSWRFKPGTVSKVRVPITFTLTGAQY